MTKEKRRMTEPLSSGEIDARRAVTRMKISWVAVQTNFRTYSDYIGLIEHEKAILEAKIEEQKARAKGAEFYGRVKGRITTQERILKDEEKRRVLYPKMSWKIRYTSVLNEMQNDVSSMRLAYREVAKALDSAAEEASKPDPCIFPDCEQTTCVEGCTAN
jgi:hypothetical protein